MSGGQTFKDFDVETVLKTLSLAEKISLLAGKDFWHTADVSAKGVPPVRMSDGPNGVRGTQFFNGTPAACFPCGTGLGASFDVDLAKEVGDMLGQECILKGAHIILGPTINIQRSPLGGRGFESYSEDPNLSGRLAAGYVEGVQGRGVAATMKHFVGNEQEFERFSNDSIISTRALREIYLEPFRIAQKLAKPHCYMTSYNRVNGTHVSENKEILDGILRKEWGFEGMVMSDWTGVYSCDTSIKAGLDLEMPGPPAFRGAQVSRQMQAGKLFEWDIDERVRKVLGMVKLAIASGIPFNAKEKFADTPELRSLLRKAAQNAIVLLKNEQNALPIKSAKKIAVIGSNARVAVTSGGGSAALLSSYTVTPLEGITAAAKEIGAEVDFAIGSASYQFLPAATKLCSPPEGAQAGEQDHAFLEFWLGEPPADWLSDKAGVKVDKKPDHTVPSNSLNAFFMDGLPQHINGGGPYIRMTADFIPDQDGDWEFGFGSVGSANLYIDGKLAIDNSSKWEPGQLWFHMGSAERRGVVKGLQKGRKYSIEVRCAQREDLRGSPFKTAGALRVGALPVTDPKQAIEDAVKAAKAADVAVVVVGLNEDFESEGYDRTTMDLPGTSNELVSAVLKANPKAIIVNQSGTPVSMPWIDEAPTLVQAFYGGNDLGNALADVLFGKVNPCSKLPLTFPKRLQDSPSDLGFGITSETPGKTFYSENIYVGYRYFDKTALAPLFPFGHGLSYTTFALSDLSVSTPSGAGAFDVSLTVSNTGNVDGSEVVQVYVSNPTSTQATPVKELRGFAKVHLKAGAKQTVKIALDRDALRYFDERRNWWIAEAKEYVVRVGTSSADLPLEQKVKLGKTLTWLGL